MEPNVFVSIVNSFPCYVTIDYLFGCKQVYQVTSTLIQPQTI